jgi:hypothetical protein
MVKAFVEGRGLTSNLLHYVGQAGILHMRSLGLIRE